ncbi:MAG TPA: hypothetical protein VKV69_09720 [Actinomycetota bacterium]|nr:hypothetical protein [Actinomycetota bacterium]
MILRQRDLARRSPPAAWEAYFLIGIFPVESSVRWCKVQLYSGCARHSLAAVEGMDREPQRLVVAASKDEVFRDEQPAAFTASPDSFEIRSSDLQWRGFPSSRLQSDHLSARADAHDPFSWVSLPRVLTYWTAFGRGAFETPLGSAEGAALVEHAWGASSSIDIGRLAPRRWQWDVLRFEDGSTCAGLSIYGRPALRSGGRAPGAPFSTGLGLRVSVLERDRDGLPARWRGRLHLHTGTVTYEARASTPVAREIAGGGFVGFEFEGSHAGRAVAGTGFTELRAR